MCRRNQLLGMFLVGLGVGLLVACWVSAPFACGCFGLGSLICGCLVLQRQGKCG